MANQYRKTPRVGLIAACLRLIEDPNRKRWQRIMLALTPLFIVWVLSPLDLIPEAFLGPLGLADDSIIIVTLFLLMRLAMSFYSEKKYVRPTEQIEEGEIVDR